MFVRFHLGSFSTILIKKATGTIVIFSKLYQILLYIFITLSSISLAQSYLIMTHDKKKRKRKYGKTVGNPQSILKVNKHEKQKVSRIKLQVCVFLQPLF